jgi:BlaI family penicillinase repressor
LIVAEDSPSQRELEILKVLWELREASVRQVHERICRGGRCAFNTVQTLLRIMEDKGLVTHRRQGRAFIYSPRHSRERVFSRFLRQVFDGALDELVHSMLRVKDATPEELKDLERIIAAKRRERQSSRPKGG